MPNLKKLTKLKEEVIVRYILDLNLWGFAPTLNTVKDIADKLLTAHAARQVSKNQPTNFINRTAELKMQQNQLYNWQRALCKDPEIISG